MNKLLWLNLWGLFIANGLLAQEKSEFSCNPEEINAYLVSLYEQAQEQKRISRQRFPFPYVFASKKDWIEQKMREQLIDNQMHQEAQDFITSAAFGCAYDTASLQALTDQIYNDKEKYGNLQLVVSPVIERLRQDNASQNNACNLAALKSIAAKLAASPAGKEALTAIYTKLPTDACKQEFAEFAKTLPAKK